MVDLALLGGEPAARAEDRPRWPLVGPVIASELVRALEPDAFFYGPGSSVRCLEEEFASRLGRRWAVATDSGTSALLLAYFASGLGGGTWGPDPGGPTPEVLVAGYGFFATASPLLHLAARPVFCDVVESNGTIDVADAERRITSRTRGIVVTHIAGHPADMDAVTELAGRHGLVVIEDGSHAHGSTYHGRQIGTMSVASAFSCQSGKILSGGEGGLLVMDDPAVYRRACALGNVRRLENADVSGSGVDLDGLSLTGLGLKRRMSPLSAALVRYLLRDLDELIDRRAESLGYIADRLSDASLGHLRPPTTKVGATRSAFYEFPMRCATVVDGVPQALLRMALEAENVPVVRSNTRAIHRHVVFRRSLEASMAGLWGAPAPAPATAQPLPVSDRLEAETLFLGTFTGSDRSVLDRCLEGIRKVFVGLDGLRRAGCASGGNE